MKTCVFDVETTGLEAVASGILLCTCVRSMQGNTKVFRLDQYEYKDNDQYGKFVRQEKDLLTDVLGELGKYDLLIGHNIENFDLGFLRTRAQILGVPFTLRPITYDTMKAFRRTHFRTVLNYNGKPSAAMDMIADFLGVGQEKTKLYPAEWWSVVWKNKKERAAEMDSIVDHCRRDVSMNHKIYNIILPADSKVVMKRWM